MWLQLRKAEKENTHLQTELKSIMNMLNDSRKYKEEKEKHFEVSLPKNLSDKELTKLIKQTEKQMKLHVINLEFEKAAICRDELKVLKDLLFKGIEAYGFF